MRFPPSFIERLRSHFLLSEVIGRRVPLKKHGREYQGLCPFHNEKTPSFTVNDEKNFFHCFGCAAHGDAIGFVMRFERLTYPEAIERMAREAGIALPAPDPIAFQKAEAEKTLYDACDAAREWFERQLAAPAGLAARGYLEKRGLKPETIDMFRIGFAPEERASLHQHLLKAGFSTPLQAEAGLIIIPEQGSPYDRFRGRIIFPIRNASGKTVAFGGRLITNSGGGKAPKYLNSPETPLFKKGELLYNLDLAKAPARAGNVAVVMEGYMDVVSTWQSGVDYAVATLGTAVTPEHLKLLWRLTKEPVMCLDGDAAGARAMMRAAEIALPMLAPGLSLRFATLPRGEDPDTYVQKNGKTSFEKLLRASRMLSQVIWESLSPHYKCDLPEGRAALEDACRKLAYTIADNSVKQHYISYFKSQLWAKSPQAKNTGQPRSQAVEQMLLTPQSAALESVVRQMLATLLRFPVLLHKSQVEETLSRLDIRNPRFDALRHVLLAAQEFTDIDDREIFVAHVRGQLSGDEIVERLLADAPNLPYRDSLSAMDAGQLWSEIVGAYEIAHLHLELEELQESFGQSMDEAAYHRMIELQAAIKKAQSERRFAPVQEDVA